MAKKVSVAVQGLVDKIAPPEEGGKPSSLSDVVQLLKDAARSVDKSNEIKAETEDGAKPSRSVSVIGSDGSACFPNAFPCSKRYAKFTSCSHPT